MRTWTVRSGSWTGSAWSGSGAIMSSRVSPGTTVTGIGLGDAGAGVRKRLATQLGSTPDPLVAGRPPLDADILAVLHGMKDLAPKSLPVRLRFDPNYLGKAEASPFAQQEYERKMAEIERERPHVWGGQNGAPENRPLYPHRKLSGN